MAKGGRLRPGTRRGAREVQKVGTFSKPFLPIQRHRGMIHFPLSWEFLWRSAPPPPRLPGFMCPCLQLTVFLGVPATLQQLSRRSFSLSEYRMSVCGRLCAVSSIGLIALVLVESSSCKSALTLALPGGAHICPPWRGGEKAARSAAKFGLAIPTKI